MEGIMNMVCSIWNWLIKVEENSSTDYLLTIISISVAAFVIFLSLSVIPFQKISTEISGNLYKLFLKQRKFILPVFTNLFICLTQIACYPFCSSNKLVEIIYIYSLTVILVNAYKYTKKIKIELDISYTIYPLIEEDFDKSIKLLLEKECELKKNNIYSQREAEKLLSDRILYQINIEENKLGYPFEKYDRIFIFKFQSLYDILIKSVENHQYGTYEKAVECLFLCQRKYFKYIENHIVIVDNVFLDFLEMTNKVLEKTKKLENTLYSDLLINSLSMFVLELDKYNINHDFYFQKIIDLYFNCILMLSNDFVVGCNRIMNIIPIFTGNNKLLWNSLEKFSECLIIFQKEIYNQDDSLNKTMINKLINVFSFEILTNYAFLKNTKAKEIIFNLQEIIDAVDVYPPLPGMSDFTTSIETIGTDKTLCSVIKKTIPYYINEDINTEKINYVEFIERIVQILINRFNKGGTHKSGIQDQLYCIFFEIFKLLDVDTFRYLYSTNIIFYPLRGEKEKLLNILCKIIEFESQEKASYFFSELKFLFVLLAKDNTITNFVKTNERWFVFTVFNNQKLDYRLKIAIYSYYKTLLPKKKKKIFVKYIKKLYKANRMEYPIRLFIEQKYNVYELEIAYLDIPLPLKEFYKKYINQMIFLYLPFKKSIFKEKILTCSYPCEIEDIYVKFENISSIFIQGVLFELIEDQQLYRNGDKILLHNM